MASTANTSGGAGGGAGAATAATAATTATAAATEVQVPPRYHKMLAGGLTVKQVAAWMTKDGHAAEVIATFEDSIDPEAAELCVVRNIDSLPPRQQLAYHVMVKFGLPLDEVVMVLQKLTGQRAMKPPTSIDALQTRIDSIGGATSAAWQEALASRRESCVAQAVTADDAAAADDAAEPAAVAADTSATDDSNDDNNDAGAAAVPP